MSAERQYVRSDFRGRLKVFCELLIYMKPYRLCILSLPKRCLNDVIPYARLLTCRLKRMLRIVAANIDNYLILVYIHYSRQNELAA